MLTSAIISAVVFFLLREVVAVAIIVIGVTVTGVLGASVEALWPKVVTVLLTIFGVIAWEIVAIVWIVSDVVYILQVIAGTA